MNKNISIFLIIFFSVLLQVSFFPNIIPRQIFPDIALIIILFWTVERGFEETWKWTILTGLMIDLAYFWPIGASVFSFVFTAYVINSLTKRFLVNQTIFRFLILVAFIIFGTILNDMITISAVKFARREMFDFNMLFLNFDIFLKIFCNLGMFLLIYVPLVKLEKFFGSLDLRLKSFR